MIQDIYSPNTVQYPIHERIPDKARLISRAYRHMGVTAVNVGDLDLMQGLTLLKQEASRGLPLISANLIDLSLGTPIPPVIKKVDNVRIAFIGLLSPDINAAIQKIAGGKGYIKGPISTAQEITGKLRGQADITELFWCLWQIELFFKWIKQHLRIKAFYGTTENAVKTQIWIAIVVYVLVAIVKKQLHLDLSLYTILQILSVTVFEKTLNLGAFSIIQSQESERVICNQLTLFD